MKVIIVTGIHFSGGTAKAEQITEELNHEGRKTICLGETDWFQKGIKHKSHELGWKKYTYCSCGKKYDSCPFWGEIERSLWLEDNYQSILDKAEEAGYEFIVDSSRSQTAFIGWDSVEADIEKVVYIFRNPFSWTKSVKEKYGGNRIFHFFKWIGFTLESLLHLNRFLRKYPTEFEFMRWYELEHKYDERKHIFTGSEGKFRKE